jgi:antitoxin component YwqK of YwqJK toxin-antitoxin module
MLSNNILYEIGLKIDKSSDFLNYICSFKNISNKRQLIEIKRKSFLKKIERENEEYSILPNGWNEGPSKEWYDDKKIRMQCNYFNGYMDGSYDEWHRNGQLYKQYKCINGEKQGLYLV